MEISLELVRGAAERIRGGVQRTELSRSVAFSKMTGVDVWLKHEYRQSTGSFKERGARNALMQLDSERRARGVIAASAGNHALALAHHGRDLGIPVTVVMPKFAPLMKQSRCRALGADVKLFGAHIDEAKEYAMEFVANAGKTYVHGFDAPEVIIGQGTIGLELIEQRPDLDAVIVPIGGAGLIAGVGYVLRQIAPDCEVIGVEPEHAATYSAALAKGGPYPAPIRPSLADGLSVPKVGTNAYEIAREVVSQVVQVSEAAIARSILRLLEYEKCVVEGGGASALAALLEDQLPHLRGKRVALLLCGGNIDSTVLGRVIEYGLAADGRLSRFRTRISDRPGGLASLAKMLADAQASVKQITHERAFAGADVTTVEVECIIETRDQAHLDAVKAKLEAEGMPCRE